MIQMFRIKRSARVLPVCILIGLMLVFLSLLQFRSDPSKYNNNNNNFEERIVKGCVRVSSNDKNEFTEQINCFASYNRHSRVTARSLSNTTTTTTTIGNNRQDTSINDESPNLTLPGKDEHEPIEMTYSVHQNSSNKAQSDIKDNVLLTDQSSHSNSQHHNSLKRTSGLEQFTKVWQPLISLHSVKHMFKIELSKTFIRQKLLNLSRTYDMETDKLKKKHKEPETPVSDVCPFYFNDTTIQKTVLPRFYGKCSNGYDPDEVTLLIQMDTSHGYFSKLHDVTRHWSGPVSVAVFVNVTRDKLLSSDRNLRKEMKEMFDKYHLHDTAVCVHIVSSEEGLHFYPVNTMRNVAIKYAQTDMVFLIEADFIPMPQLDKVFQRTWLKKNLHRRKLAYIVPSFSMESFNHSIPLTKKQLLQQWQRNITIPIHYSKSFKSGHKPTDYKRYAYANKAYKVNYQTRYEPYYVVNRKNTPYYPEEFLHGFKDKSVHAKILNDTGFEFHVLPNTFIVHTPHVMPYARDEGLFQCALIALEDFTEEFNTLNSKKVYYR